MIPPKQHTESEMEKRFDERFCIPGNRPRWIFGSHLKQDSDDREIKSFIRSELSLQAQQLKKEVEGMKAIGDFSKDETSEQLVDRLKYNCEVVGFNRALSQVLTLLDKYIK